MENLLNSISRLETAVEDFKQSAPFYKKRKDEDDVDVKEEFFRINQEIEELRKSVTLSNNLLIKLLSDGESNICKSKRDIHQELKAKFGNLVVKEELLKKFALFNIKDNDETDKEDTEKVFLQDYYTKADRYPFQDNSTQTTHYNSVSSDGDNTVLIHDCIHPESFPESGSWERNTLIGGVLGDFDHYGNPFSSKVPFDDVKNTEDVYKVGTKFEPVLGGDFDHCGNSFNIKVPFDDVIYKAPNADNGIDKKSTWTNDFYHGKITFDDVSTETLNTHEKLCQEFNIDTRALPTRIAVKHNENKDFGWGMEHMDKEKMLGQEKSSQDVELETLENERPKSTSYYNLFKF